MCREVCEELREDLRVCIHRPIDCHVPGGTAARAENTADDEVIRVTSKRRVIRVYVHVDKLTRASVRCEETDAVGAPRLLTV